MQFESNIFYLVIELSSNFMTHIYIYSFLLRPYNKKIKNRKCVRVCHHRKIIITSQYNSFYNEKKNCFILYAIIYYFQFKQGYLIKFPPPSNKPLGFTIRKHP